MEKKERPTNKKLKVQSSEEARKNGRKGGLKSGQVRREKADFKRKCQMWMETEVAKDKNGKAMTGADLMIAVAGKEIKNGSAKFWELMRDTAGFKPIDKVVMAEVDQDVIDEVEAMVLGTEKDNAKKNEA